MEFIKQPQKLFLVTGLAICVLAILCAIDFTFRLFVENEDAVLDSYGAVKYLESVGKLLQPASAGYIKVGSTSIESGRPDKPAKVYDHHLYYYLSPAQTRPDTAPVVIWTGGGERGEESALLAGFAGILPYTFQSNRLMSTLATFQANVNARVLAQSHGIVNYDAIDNELDEEEARLEAETGGADLEGQTQPGAEGSKDETSELVELTDLGVNPRAWNRRATVVLVDPIPGVGFSFTAPAPGSWPKYKGPYRRADSATAPVPFQVYFNSSEVIADNLEAFLERLAERYPTLVKGRQLILAGGGYMAGRVLPHLAERLLAKQEQAMSEGNEYALGRVKALLMLSPIIDPASQYARIPSILAANGLIDAKAKSKLDEQVAACKRVSRKDKKNAGSLQRAKVCAIPATAQRLLGPLRLQDIREACNPLDMSEYVETAKAAVRALRSIRRAEHKEKKAKSKSKADSESVAAPNLDNLSDVMETSLVSHLPSPAVNAFLDTSKLKSWLSKLTSRHNETADKLSDVPEHSSTAVPQANHTNTSGKARQLAGRAVGGLRDLTKGLYDDIKIESSPPPFLQNPNGMVNASQPASHSMLSIFPGASPPPAIAAGLPESGFRKPPKALSSVGDSLRDKLPLLFELDDDDEGDLMVGSGTGFLSGNAARSTALSFSQLDHLSEERLNAISQMVTGYEGNDARIIRIVKSFLRHPRVKRQLFANGQLGVNHDWNSRAYEAHLALTIDSSRSSADALLRLMKSQARREAQHHASTGVQPKPFRILIVGGQFDFQLCPTCLDAFFTSGWTDADTEAPGEPVMSVGGVPCVNLALALVEAQKLVNAGILSMPQHAEPTAQQETTSETVDAASGLGLETSSSAKSRRRRRRSRKSNAQKPKSASSSQSSVYVEDTATEDEHGESPVPTSDVMTAYNLLMSLKDDTNTYRAEQTAKIHEALQALDSLAETSIVESLLELRNKCFVPESKDVDADIIIGDLQPRRKRTHTLMGYQNPVVRPYFVTSRNRGNSLAGYYRSGDRTQPLSRMLDTIVLSSGAAGSLGLVLSQQTPLFSLLDVLLKDKRLRPRGSLKKLLESSNPTIASAARELATKRAKRRAKKMEKSALQRQPASGEL